MLTDSVIDNAIKLKKADSSYDSSYDGHHEHNDCIRMAYEWLDAQKKIKGKIQLIHPIKHLVEQWSGRYVSTSDVIIAASLHPSIHGKYPQFNISSRLTLPSDSRLKAFPQARSMDYTLEKSDYKIFEQ